MKKLLLLMALLMLAGCECEGFKARAFLNTIDCNSDGRCHGVVKCYVGHTFEKNKRNHCRKMVDREIQSICNDDVYTVDRRVAIRGDAYYFFTCRGKPQEVW